MERLNIDEIIDHCNKKVIWCEKIISREQFENRDTMDAFCREYWEHRQVAEYLKELQHYRNLEEQGLLLRLPCKAKQIVYIIDPNLCRRKNKPFKCEVDEFIVEEFSCFAVLNACECHNAMRRFKAVHINCFGITVFLTREEAEAALQRMKGEENE